MSLGILNGNTLTRPPRRGVGALGASTIPGKCWDQPGFKDCHARQWSQARDDCAATGAPDFGGNQSKCIETMTDAYAFNNCMEKYCPQAPLVSAPVQVGPIFSSGDPCGSQNTIKYVQWLLKVAPDGNWGTKSKAAYEKNLATTGNDWYDLAKGCVGDGPYPREVVTVTPVPVPTPVPITPDLPPVEVLPKPGVSKAAMMAGVGIFSALAVGTYYVGKKQGWF